MTFDTELEFLRALEQQIQKVHWRIVSHYSGIIEVIDAKKMLNDHIADLLEEKLNSEPSSGS